MFVCEIRKFAGAGFTARLRVAESLVNSAEINQFASSVNGLAAILPLLSRIENGAGWNHRRRPQHLAVNKAAFPSRSRFSPCSFSPCSQC
jgi:hypothetical protein